MKRLKPTDNDVLSAFPNVESFRSAAVAAARSNYNHALKTLLHEEHTPDVVILNGIIGYGNMVKYSMTQPAIPTPKAVKGFFSVFMNRRNIFDVFDYVMRVKTFIMNLPEENYRELKSTFTHPQFYMSDPIFKIMDLWYVQATLLSGMSAMLEFNKDNMIQPQSDAFTPDYNLLASLSEILSDESASMRLRHDSIISWALKIIGATRLKPEKEYGFLMTLLDEAQPYFNDLQADLFSAIIAQRQEHV